MMTPSSSYSMMSDEQRMMPWMSSMQSSFECQRRHSLSLPMSCGVYCSSTRMLKQKPIAIWISMQRLSFYSMTCDAMKWIDSLQTLWLHSPSMQLLQPHYLPLLLPLLLPLQILFLPPPHHTLVPDYDLHHLYIHNHDPQNRQKLPVPTMQIHSSFASTMNSDASFCCPLKLRQKMTFSNSIYESMPLMQNAIWISMQSEYPRIHSLCQRTQSGNGNEISKHFPLYPQTLCVSTLSISIWTMSSFESVHSPNGDCPSKPMPIPI